MMVHVSIIICLVIAATALFQSNQRRFFSRRTLVNYSSALGKKCLADEDNCVHVVLAAEGLYIAPLFASISSMYTSTRDISIHLLVGKGETDVFVGTDAFRKFLPEVPIEILEFDDSVVSPLITIWEGSHFHRNTLNYARFFLQDLFPHLSYMIYMDPDTITRGNLGEMVKLFKNIRKNEPHMLLAAVPYNYRRWFRGTYAYILNCFDTEISAAVNCTEPYFNAGVFVTNLQLWRAARVRERLEIWMGRNANRQLWKLGSQAPFNLVFSGRWAPLAPVWNFRQSERDKFLAHDEQYLDKIKIMHFAGKRKPWTSAGTKQWRYWCPHYPLRSIDPMTPFCRNSSDAHTWPG